jgi:hypothetical protein
MMTALHYVGLIGMYVEFEQLDGEEPIIGGVVRAVADQPHGAVLVTFENDQCLLIEREACWGLRVFRRSPWLINRYGEAEHAAADAAATTYGDERYGRPRCESNGADAQ